MITYDYLTLKAFFEENKNFFMGARLQKIQQPTRRDFLLTIRGVGETKKLYINIDPQVFHLCFLNDTTTNRRNIQIPKKPPMFCMLLRKHLEGFRIARVNVPSNERIFEIYFESYNELNEEIKLCLAIELMGKYSNVILYNADTNIIIGCAHNVGPEKSRERELAGTLPYTYPQKQIKGDFLYYNGTLDYDLLNESFYGISKAFQNQLKKNKITLDKIKRFIAFDYPLSPAYNDTEFSIYSELIASPVVCSSINEMIDGYFSCRQQEILTRALRLKLRNAVLPQYNRYKTLSEKISSKLLKTEKAGKYKKYADLIMANLYNNEDYIKELKVTDWENNCQIQIPMDELLTLKENAQRYYKLYSKSKSSVEKLEQLLNESKQHCEYYSSILYNIKSTEKLSDLYEILSECEETGLIKKSETTPKQKEINVEEATINDYTVYIGKNNKQNDYIITKLSSPNDIWFHIQNNTGSHILLKTKKNLEPDDRIIYECAKLAKQYSSASSDIKAGVIYTKRKYLKKPPGANLGYVTYREEKEIIVD